MAKEVNNEEWHKIGDSLTQRFNICGCQRKLKTIIDNFYSIYLKLVDFQDNGVELQFTGMEWLIIAMLDKNSNAVCHGVNCEYPIINTEDDFWKWIIETKDNPNLEDN